MRDLEAEMAAALEGKFFWQPSREEDHLSPAEFAIKKAQEKFRGKAKPERTVMTDGEIDRRVDRITKMVRTAIHVTGQKDPAIVLRNIVAFCYDIDPSKVITQTNNPDICRAKHHYYWMLMRMNSKSSTVEVAEIIGRQHSAIIRSRDIFESIKHERTSEIEIINRVVEAVGCGF